MSNLTPKPKVVAAVVGGILASAILSNITLITPDLFSGLGKASGLVYGLTITLVIGVCGWLKSDGEPADATKDATASDTPSVPQPSTAPAPATTFPKAAVDAAVASEADLPLAPVPVVPEVPAPAVPNTIA